LFIGAYTTIVGWSINQWAAGVGIVGVCVNLWFGWKRHLRETRRNEYDNGLREDRRSDACLRCNVGRRKSDAIT
jgi:hypothetical protein